MIKKLMQSRRDPNLVFLVGSSSLSKKTFSGTVVRPSVMFDLKIGTHRKAWKTSWVTPYRGEPIQLPPVEKINWHEENGWVEDDNGVYWFYNYYLDAIICVGDDTDYSDGGCKICCNLRDGIEVLQEEGYISKDKIL